MTANQIAYQRNLETNRSNLAQESENKRHNLRTEDLGIKNLSEQQRHNYATEMEANRSNLAREMETTRSNRAKEALTSIYNDARISQGWASIEETNRANLAKEEDTDLSRDQADYHFYTKSSQDYWIADEDRKQREDASKRSAFSSVLSSGIGMLSGIAKAIVGAATK